MKFNTKLGYTTKTVDEIAERIVGAYKQFEISMDRDGYEAEKDAVCEGYPRIFVKIALEELRKQQSAQALPGCYFLGI